MGVAPGTLQVGALRERAAAGGLEHRVDRADRPLAGDDLVATDAQPQVERDLLAALDERDPELAENVRARMLTFDDLVRLDARDVQQVLRGVDAALLAVAMKGATPAVEQVIVDNLSERHREVLADEVRLLGPVRLSQVEDARAAIVRAIRDLEATGAITVQRGDEDAYVE